MKEEVFILHSQGHPDGDLHIGIFNGFITGGKCGDIKDGIVMDFENSSGGWVVSTQDFIALADRVKQERDA